MSNTMTNDQIITRFTKHLQRQDMSPNTIRSFTSTVTKLSQSIQLSQATMFDIEDFIDSLKSTNQPQTINQRLNALRSFFSYITDANIIQSNPMNGIKDVKLISEKKEYELLTYDQYREIFNCTRVKLRDKVTIGLGSLVGLRVSEVCNVKVEDINFKKNTITIVGGKGNKTETVAIPTSLCNLIQEYMLDNNIEKGYIINVGGKKVSSATINDRWKKVLKTMGYDETMSFHKNRHFCGSRLSNNGSLVVASKQLRHASTRTTEQFYVHKNIDRMIEDVNNINNLF